MLSIGIVSCVLGLVFGVLAARMAKRSPNHISCGFVLELSILMFLNGILFIVWSMGTPSDLTLLIMSIPIYAVWILYAVIGIALIVNGAVTVRREGASLTHVLPFGWGILLIFVSYWLSFGPGMAFSGTSEAVAQAITFVTYMVAYIPFALFGAWLSNDICYKSRKEPERGYIVALGCGLMPDGTATPLLKTRLDAAIRAYEAGGRQAKIIVSGGQGPNEVVSEARAMANYLLEQGVPESSILLEDASTTTEENLRYSLAIINERGGAEKFTIATSDYHCLRAAMFARKLKMNVRCVGGHTPAFFYPAAFFREYIALISRNRYAVALFIAFAFIRCSLEYAGILPEGII